ncbi:hypothetical protein LTS18_003756 [Coniosporium uncinatum]|uniref:Uncharacterized protein n=1 Tax=Coniosporium uncinatum TaxID=93489 RepID=A0ACC3D702_9PEZI|nr:hypothetical protein LTS18_003756 [Coniosporium uncinatum]
MVLKAGYPNQDHPGWRKVCKATILVKKKEGMSDEDFIKHYNGVHAQMAAPVLQKHKIISYSLVRPSLSHSSSAFGLQDLTIKRDRTIMQDILKGKAQLLDYDAICTFVFPDYLSFARFLYDKDSAAMNPDHVNFMDESQMKMMVGDEYMVIEDGQKVG